MMSIIAQAVPALDTLNPIGILEDASKNVPGFEGGLSSALNIVLLLTVLTVAPAILILCTCFTRMVVVLGLRRCCWHTLVGCRIGPVSS